jgi:hypothetical protein
MRQDTITIPENPTFATGLIMLRPQPHRGRGVLLLNSAETYARISGLPGLRSASFFITPDESRVCEYVQWETPADIAAAFPVATFNEHLPVVEASCSAHPEVGFYSVRKVAMATGEITEHLGGGPTDDRFAMQVIASRPEGHEEDLEAAMAWAAEQSAAGGAIRSVVVMDDREHAKIGLFARHIQAADSNAVCFSEGWRPIDHVSHLEWHSTVAPSTPEQTMRYSMKLVDGFADVPH